MAQNEDTELRDLVMEALEKNGSLAKIRALLRANVFLAFEEDCERVKHNVSLDNILKVPEGLLSLSLVHEFLEFCNLKNTLFVYTSESRQGKEYSYEGQKKLAEKLHCYKHDKIKEPLLVTLVKNITKSFQRKFYDQGDNAVTNKDDQNCTYIVHEDSSNTSSQSNSHSDQSSDEKNKLHLRLPLDNSDTDTSSDSMRDKTCSEYIANEHIVIQDESEDDNKSNTSQHSSCITNTKNAIQHPSEEHNTGKQQRQNDISNYNYQSSDLDVATYNTTESTSYVDLKPYNTFAEKLLNTSGLPTKESTSEVKEKQPSIQDKVESPSASTLSNVTSLSSKHMLSPNKKISSAAANKSNDHSPEYTYDFSSSPSKNREADDHKLTSPASIQDFPKSPVVENPNHHSQSSQSSVSISDVADLIELSASNSPMPYRVDGSKDIKTSPRSVLKSESSLNSRSKEGNHSDDSGDFSESPIPSLSNLSLDFHSD